MTAEQYRYPYLDSSVFIAWLKGELVNGVDRKEVADHILGSAKRGTFESASLRSHSLRFIRSGDMNGSRRMRTQRYCDSSSTTILTLYPWTE